MSFKYKLYESSAFTVVKDDPGGIVVHSLVGSVEVYLQPDDDAGMLTRELSFIDTTWADDYNQMVAATDYYLSQYFGGGS